MKVKVALCQLNPLSGKPEINFYTIESVLKKYARRNVTLFIFPEDYLYGVLRNRNEIAEAGKNFDLWVKRLCVLAQRYKVDLIPGSFPLFQNGKLFNTTIYINKKGKILNQYSKTNLWLSERNEYTPNLISPKCFESVLGKTVQIICWDLMNPKVFEEAVKQNAQWIINVSLWYTNQTRDLARTRGETKNKYHIPLNRSERLNSIMETRSTEYNVGMIFCNIGGVHEYTAVDKLQQMARSAGCTQVIAPLDAVRKSVKNRNEQILVCEIPDIKDYISDHEILWGRRKDIINNYPFGVQVR